MRIVLNEIVRAANPAALDVSDWRVANELGGTDGETE